jgi:hypothetical protein
MRKLLLLTALGTLGVAGVALAAVTNQYVLTANVTPTKSGTSKAPAPIGTSLGWQVSTIPAGQRPSVVRGYKISIFGVTEATTSFPGCSTSRLLSTKKGQGPSSCPGGSQAGNGFAILSVGRSSDTSASYSSRCRIDYSIFNGGHHNVVLYFFTRSVRGQPAACPLQRPEVVNVDLIGGKSLVFSFSLPQDLRHPSSGVDSSVVSQTVNLPRNTTKIKSKTIGLFSSVACPTNHQRQIAVTFTDEQGVGRTSNRLVRCT